MGSVPTIKVLGPNGDTPIINESDLESWRAKGYKTVGEAEVETKKTIPITQAIESMTIPELREYADVRDIDISGLARKMEIIEAIRQAE